MSTVERENARREYERGWRDGGAAMRVRIGQSINDALTDSLTLDGHTVHALLNLLWQIEPVPPEPPPEKPQTKEEPTNV